MGRLARVAKIVRAVRLETKARRELDDPRACVSGYAGVQDLAERGAGRIRVRIGELGVVQDVEKIAADFQIEFLRKRGDLRDTEVEIHQPRTSQRVPPICSVGAQLRAEHRLGIRRERTRRLVGKLGAEVRIRRVIVRALVNAEASWVKPKVSARVWVSGKELAGNQ